MSAAALVSALPPLARVWHQDDPSVRVVQVDNTTDPNATFQRESVGTTGNIVDMVICCLSFLGAIAIILPYVLNRRSRKLRHALILGLATSDLATSVVIIITTACLIANINLVQHHQPCTLLGYILVSSIFSQHLWNLSIAIVTYMILVHPLSNFTLTVEKRVRWLWPIFWLLSFAINAIPFALGGFGFRGGYCAFTTPFLFTSLFQFVPRAVVFVVILCLYTHLFFFLRRTNLFSRANHSNSLSRSRQRSANPQSQPQLNANAAHHQALLVAPPAPQEHASSAPSSSTEHSTKTSNASRIAPPVLNKNDPTLARRRSSSLGEKDASVEMTTLDPASRRRNHSYADAYTKDDEDNADTSLSGLLSYTGPRGVMDPNYTMASPRTRMPAQLDIERANAPHYDASSITAHSPSNASSAGAGPSASLSAKGSSAPLNASFPRGSDDAQRPTASRRPVTAGASGAEKREASTARRASAGDSRYATARDTDVESVDSDEGSRRMRPRKDAGDFDMMTPPVEHLKHYTAPVRSYARMADILAMGDDEMARARTGLASDRRSSAVQILPGEVVVEMPSKEAFEESLGDDWNWGMDVTTKNEHARSSKRVRDDTGLHTGTSSTSSQDENGVESIGSTLNRQASLLLLLYPAAYCLLFSISIARLAVDLADPAASVRNAHDWLHQLSRWLIFAQGAIDAIIFQFIERQFRQRMKRRRRKAMGEPINDSFSHRVGKLAVAQVKRSLHKASQTTHA